MSDAAIAWAISPPIVPAPTTAALKTNIGLGASEIVRGGKSRREASGRGPGAGRPRADRGELLDLEPEPQQRPLQRLGHLAADEEALGEPGERAALRERVRELETDRRRLAPGDLELGSQLAARLRVRERDPVQAARLVREHPLADRPRPAGVERQTSVPPCLRIPGLRLDRLEAVDPGRPAGGVEVVVHASAAEAWMRTDSLTLATPASVREGAGH